MTTTSNMTAKESFANITRIIGNIANNLARYRNYVQEGGLAVMRHADAFGDVTPAVKLMRALNPRDRAQFYAWLSANSPCRITIGKEPGDDKCRLAKPGDDGQRQPFAYESASANNWWEFDKQPPVKTPKAVLEFFDSLQRAVTMTDKKLEGYSPADREAVKAQAVLLSAVIAEHRAKVAQEAAAQTAAGLAALLGDTTKNISTVISRAA